jgi:hypothetical protein
MLWVALLPCCQRRFMLIDKFWRHNALECHFI